MNALLGAWFEQRKPSLYYLMKMKKFYSITQNSILFPVSLNYIENRRVLHFGIILDTAWYPHKSLFTSILYIFASYSNFEIISRGRKGRKKPLKVRLVIKLNCFERNSLTLYQQRGSVFLKQKQLGEETFTSIRMSKVRQALVWLHISSMSSGSELFLLGTVPECLQHL